ncbi:hypothetical protein Q7P37_010659 [Cladosporium fusiforme]
MPDLLSRATTRLQLAQLAECLPRRCCVAQVRQRHDISAQNEAAHSLLQTQPIVIKDGQLMRSRKHGFRSLPLSPLLSEGRRKPSKSAGRDVADDEALAEFQKEVAMNSFAHALATPIRQCTVTVARLPSHFLIPFSTIIERTPPASKGQPSKIKAHIQPGIRSDHPSETLGQASYIINRQDMVRHLSRKRHWASLITERQKAKVASIAHRSPNAQKLVQELWAWDDQTDATVVLLENRVKATLVDTFNAMKADKSSSAGRERKAAFALVFGVLKPDDKAQSIRDITCYNLSDLLSSEIVDGLKADYDVADIAYVPKGPEALLAQLALEKLKTHKASNVLAQLPPKSKAGRSTQESPEHEALPDEEN